MKRKKIKFKEKYPFISMALLAVLLPFTLIGYLFKCAKSGSKVAKFIIIWLFSSAVLVALFVDGQKPSTDFEFNMFVFVIPSLIAFVFTWGINIPIIVKSKTYSQKTVEIQELENIDQMDGHQFEEWCAQLVVAMGGKNVRLTKGSGDQGVDIIAELDGILYAIQCKCYSHTLGNKPVQEVNAGMQYYGCQRGVVMTNSYFTPGGKQLAYAVGVELWDRDCIASIVNKLKNEQNIKAQKSHIYRFLTDIYKADNQT